MSVQFRSRIKSALDYSDKLNSYGVCCDKSGGKDYKSFYECFTEGGFYVAGVSGSLDSVQCPQPDIRLGCCCACSYVDSGGFDQMQSYPPTTPYLASGTRNNVTKCECDRLGGKWTEGVCPSTLRTDNLDNYCVQNISGINIDARYPRACCHLGFDEITGFPTGVNCTDVCTSADCLALSTEDYPSSFATGNRCDRNLITATPSIESCSGNSLLLMSTGSQLYDGMNLEVGSCFTLQENSEGDLEYDCTLGPEILCSEYWVAPQDSNEIYCDNKLAPANPTKTNGKYSVQTMTETAFDLLGLEVGDSYQGGIYIGKFKPSLFNPVSSEVYGNINFDTPSVGTFTSDDIGNNHKQWAIIVDTLTYDVPFLNLTEPDLHIPTSLWDGYYNTYGNDAFDGLQTSLMNTIKYQNRKGFIDFYLPSIYELYFYAAYLKSNSLSLSKTILTSSAFNFKYTNIGKNQTTINGQRFVYGQILDSASSDNYKTVLINKYTKQTALFFRKIVLE
jgi:hypothetical protein